MSNGVHGLGIGQEIGPGRSADGPLVHKDHIVDLLQALHGLEKPRSALCVPLGALDPSVQDLFGEGGLAGARDTGETDKQTEWNPDVNLLEVMYNKKGEFYPPLMVFTPVYY